MLNYCRAGGFVIRFIVEHRREFFPHVMFDVEPEHAQEHMGAHTIGVPVMDRPDMQVDGLQAAERPLHLGQALVGGDCRRTSWSAAGTVARTT